jgi:RecA/RadA recombinase
MANKFVEKLRKLEGAVVDRYDPFVPENLLRSSSPGVNWLFGKNHGFPFGYSCLLWGVRKSGKTLLLYDWVGQLHTDDPDAIAIKFDTEFRDEGQLSEEMAKAWRIDMDRFLVYQVNRPEQIFDRIKGPIADMIKQGAKIKLIGIDSVTAILGRRESEQESVTNHQIGDHAMTMQIGLKSIIETQRKHKIALVLTAHARDEMDRIEIMRGNTKKPAAANAVYHHCEFIVNVERNFSKDGKTDSLGNKFVDESREDFSGDAEVTGHKIKVFMSDSTLGPKNRQIEFTLAYKQGIVNQNEEIMKLGLGWGIINHPKKGSYEVGETKYTGKPNLLEGLKDPKIQQYIISKLIERESDPTFINTTTVSDAELED